MPLMPHLIGLAFVLRKKQHTNQKPGSKKTF